MSGSRCVSSGLVEVGLRQQLSSIVTVYLGSLKAPESSSPPPYQLHAEPWRGL